MTDHDYWSPKQVVSSQHYSFSMGQLRYFLLYRHKNGLEKAVRKIGKRLLIRTDLFEKWIELQGRQEIEL
jgi:hypothetical protein